MTATTSTLRKKRGTAKKTTRKTAKKSAASKTATRKKTTKKIAKKTTSKTGTRKKTASKATARKKTAGKKAPVKKAAAGKKTAAKTATKKKTTTAKSAARRSSANVVTGPGLGKAYQSKRGEDYMSKAQLEHFRQKLLDWQKEIIADLSETMNHLKDGRSNLADPNDRATQESEFALELRTRDRERKLLKKISQALARIADGSYGYCEETGDEIGIARLEIRPVATLCVEAQERREREERQFVDLR